MLSLLIPVVACVLTVIYLLFQESSKSQGYKWLEKDTGRKW